MNKDNPKKKESVVDLSRFIDQRVRVKFQGGREASGTLKGYDTLLNLVLDNCIEFLRDPEDPFRLTGETRALGLIVARGSAITICGPADGVEEIENPFAVADE
uniref:Sm domain-containing protein n=1 Tax=Panagrolaimus sp. PS1159 TaxID=55785 RepID=A0AC35GNM5_9BILA